LLHPKKQRRRIWKNTNWGAANDYETAKKGKT